MALNPNYVPLTPLWEVFTDKDLLTFLSDGYVRFYIDTERTVGKPVYQLTGSPPNYSYTPYGFLDTDGSWRVNMNLQGAFDQVIYGYPLDEDGNVQLYFADFFNSDGVFQFSREGFPNFFISGGTNGQQVDINYIPDGQFRLHEDIPKTLTLELGEVREPITNVAYGGWTFERPSASIARDFVTFQRIGSYVTNPVKSPRYWIELTCEAPNAGDTFKNLGVRFDDVNKFASDTEMFTFAITGKVVSSGSITVELVLIKNFGTGGDATTETILTSFPITSTSTNFYYAFVFGNNTGKIIGQDNDDYVQLALRLPSNELLDVQFTDALLTPGNIVNPIFNDTTTREFLYESLFDDTDCPAFDGYDIGLPLVLTKTGLRFDDSQVGMIFATSSTTVPYGFLPGDGSSYDTILHSSDGIPYYRLLNKLLVNYTSPLAFSIPAFGTGANFVTCGITADKKIRINTNSAGAVANFSNGAVSPGFTFQVNHLGETTTESKAYSAGAATIYIRNDLFGNTAAGVSGNVSGSSATLISGQDAKTVYTITFNAVPSASQYIAWERPNSTSYVVWYKLDGTGTQPSVPGASAYLEVDLFTGVNTQDVADITANAISGFHCEEITTVAGSIIPQSSYINFASQSQSYYGWFNIGGAGIDPMIVGKIGVEIKIESSDTADQIASKTATSLNTRFFSTPDLRGLFLKGLNGTSTQDATGAALRYATNSINYGNAIGSREYSNNISHSHELYSTGGGLTNAWSFGTGTTPTVDPSESINNVTDAPSMTDSGSTESRPENIYVNYVIKY